MSKVTVVCGIIQTMETRGDVCIIFAAYPLLLIFSRIHRVRDHIYTGNIKIPSRNVEVGYLTVVYIF